MAYTNTISRTTDSSPVFIGDIDPITILETLEGFQTKLAQRPSAATIGAIENTLQSWDIITMIHDGKNKWLACPLTIEKTKTKRPMNARIAHLIKSGGEWKSNNIQSDVIETRFITDVPLHISVSKNTENNVLLGRASLLLVAIVHLHSILQQILEDGATTVGIFERPNGVVNMNRLYAWFSENERLGEWSIKDALAVKNVYDVVTDATYSVSK